MILLLAIFFILIQPILEAVQNAFKPEWNPIIRKIGWIIRIAIGVIWFFTCTSPEIYYVETWKLIVGYIFVAFMIYDTVWNLTSIICGKDISIWYYGTTKWYDRKMTKLGSWGWFVKAIAGTVGIVFLMGWS
jgi:hypothetical protein